MSNYEEMDRPSTDGEMEGQTADPSDDRSEQSQAELRAQLEQLRSENRRLRRAYAAAQRTRYRRTAFGLYLIGGLSVGAALLFPDVRSVLFGLGATGLFAGILTYYLTPERFTTARVSERIAVAHAATLSALVADLGLQGTQVYIPSADTDGQLSDVLLFMPHAAQYELPQSPTAGIIVPETRRAQGLAIVPTGGVLLQEFERTIDRPLPEDPVQLAGQLADGVAEQFELADTVRTELSPLTTASPHDLSIASDAASESDDANRLMVVSEEPIFETEMIDNPITSFIGAGVAKALDVPVKVSHSSITEEGTHRMMIQWENSSGDGST